LAITLRILHLEDTALDAELIHATLADAGFACDATLVETREAFVEAIEGGPFDIILADFRLPSFDGLCALELARELCPDTPFIFVYSRQMASGLLVDEAEDEECVARHGAEVNRNKCCRASASLASCSGAP